MDTSTGDGAASQTHHVFLLRLWREHNGHWHTTLRDVDATTPQHFANLDALVAFLTAVMALSTDAPPSDVDERG